ncbi:BRCA1 C Terminus (BRCT) domain family protein [Candida albicans]|uniref:BRCA1 C Terminus (BRCT) domain family protein n=1 Tax=Candida albicans TaxID=5476 RepID=A0A8H6F592_CANAX|nr:BRCA1 C Terminus (BRCT) domain family protein [Candida albicans]
MSLKPFTGLLFCCTGLESTTRREVVEKIETLGGIHYSDLMTDVNYLIVGDRDTEKYRFCIKYRPDIIFIDADSIFTIHKHWINGEDENSDLLRIEKYRLAIFAQLNACFSRIEMSTSQIDHLVNTVKFRQRTNTSPEYFRPKNLFKLFVDNADPRGTRYNKALEWNVPAIHPIWIVDSVLRGAALDWKDYILNNNPNDCYDRGCDVWPEVFDCQEKQKQKSQQQPKRSESTEPEVKRKITNNKTNADIWNSIMDHTKKQTKQLIHDKTWDDDDEEEEEDDDDDTQTKNEKVNQYKNITTIPNNGKQKPELNGFNYYTVGFDSREFDLLSKAIENYSGEISNDPNDDSITHVVIPAKKGYQSMSVLKVLPADLKSRIANGFVKIVTEFFIERCMFYKKIILDRWGQPMKGLVPSKKSFKICTTGFTGIELLHIEKLIRAFNFEYCETLSEQRDLLILNVNLFKKSLMNSPKLFQYKCKDIINCPTGGSVSLMSSKHKVEAAKRWNIPVVSVAYLWEILELSTNKSHIIMPDITDLQWCVFAPSNYNKPKSLLEYVKNLDKASRESSFSPKSQENEALEEPTMDNSVRLPSPRRVNSKQKYGKLVGGKSPKSIKRKLLEAANSFADGQNDHSINPDVTIEEDSMSQIRYQDNESMINQERLLEKLDGSAVLVETSIRHASKRSRKN